MTFPRVFHSDLFSDSGPVDGTVLVNAHSDAIEALQATDTIVTDSATLGGVTGANGQAAYVTDSGSHLALVWDAAVAGGPGDWSSVRAAPLFSGGASSPTEGAASGQATGLASLNYVDGALFVVDLSGNWIQVRAIDPNTAAAQGTANYAVSMLPTVGTGSPVGVVTINDPGQTYYDESVSPPHGWIADSSLTWVSLI